MAIMAKPENPSVIQDFVGLARTLHLSDARVQLAQASLRDVLRRRAPNEPRSRGEGERVPSRLAATSGRLQMNPERASKALESER